MAVRNCPCVCGVTYAGRLAGVAGPCNCTGALPHEELPAAAAFSRCRCRSAWGCDAGAFSMGPTKPLGGAFIGNGTCISASAWTLADAGGRAALGGALRGSCASVLPLDELLAAAASPRCLCQSACRFAGACDMGPATALGGGGGALETFGLGCASAGACPLVVVCMCAESGGAFGGGLLGPALGTLGP